MLGPATAVAQTASRDRLRAHAGRALERHIEAVTAAQNLQAKNIPGLKEEQLTFYIKKVRGSGNVVWPYGTTLAILRRHGLDLEPGALLATMWPWAGTQEAFDPANPRLASLPGTDEQKAQAFLQCIMVDRVEHSMSKVEASITDVDARLELSALSEALSREYESSTAPTRAEGPLHVAVAQCQTWMKTIVALIAPSRPGDDRGRVGTPALATGVEGAVGRLHAGSIDGDQRIHEDGGILDCAE